MRMKVLVPVFKSEKESYEGYLANVEVWSQLCRLPKAEQALMLWYSLPDDQVSDIKTKIYNEVGLDNLKNDNGAQRFKDKLNEAFKPEAQRKVYDIL